MSLVYVEIDTEVCFHPTSVYPMCPVASQASPDSKSNPCASPWQVVLSLPALPLIGAKPKQVDIDRRRSHQHSVSWIPSILLCWWHSCEHSCCLCSLHASFHFVSGERCAVQCSSLGLAPAAVACEAPYRQGHCLKCQMVLGLTFIIRK